MLRLISCCFSSVTWSKTRSDRASTSSGAVPEISSGQQPATPIWGAAPDKAEQALHALAARHGLQARSAALAEWEAALVQREAAVGQQEAHAAKAVLEAYCARYRDQAELEAALQRATELQAALQAAEEHHSREAEGFRMAFDNILHSFRAAHQEKEALRQRLEAASQELQTIQSAQATAAIEAAQPILPELDWGVARYAMDRRGPIAAGAHGSVYAAPLAIKVTKGDCRWSLEDEAEATASMNHPNICKPLFLSRHGDLLAMGMPLAQLGSLSSYLRGDTDGEAQKGFLRLPLSRQIELLQQLAEALQECHVNHHVAHMDVKPDNILMLSPGHLQLSDFGCVRDLEDATAFIDHSTEEFSCHPFLCPVSATDEAHAGARDDMWGFFITAAALLLPVSPFQRVFDRFKRMTKADRQELCERLEQAGVHLEQASHAWFQYLLLQQTREDYSVRQEFSLAEIRAVFEDTHFPLVEEYLTFISNGLDYNQYQGGYKALADPESAWDDIRQQLAHFHQLALLLETLACITPEQEAIQGTFAVSPEGRTVCLLG